MHLETKWLRSCNNQMHPANIYHYLPFKREDDIIMEQQKIQKTDQVILLWLSEMKMRRKYSWLFHTARPSSSVCFHAPGYWRNFKSCWIWDETSGSYRINSSSTQTDLASVFAFCALHREICMQQNDVGWPSAYLIRINKLYTLDDFPHLWAREKIIVVHNVPLDIKL
jgi:hypothetical protein